ncbi:hypothetical protein V8F33_011127 [Rhypophila sp. PSN 637]
MSELAPILGGTWLVLDDSPDGNPGAQTYISITNAREVFWRNQWSPDSHSKPTALRLPVTYFSTSFEPELRVPQANMCGPNSTTTIVNIVNRYRPNVKPFQDIYKDIHQNPELSRQEQRTAGVATAHLRSLDFSVYDGIGGYGVVGVFENGPGPTVLLRAELDALPILEKRGLPYASEKKMVDTDGEEKPVMHACGHDIHIAALMGVASLLEAARGGGARAMVEDGLYNIVPLPDVVLGQHVVKNKVGTLQIGPGYALAGERTFKVTIYGRGGHLSSPQECIDPVVIACAVVMRLQTIVSREIDPQETAVVTCGSFHAGYSPNAIPDQAQLTVDAAGAVEDPTIEEIEHVPPLYNDAGTVRPLKEQFDALLGGDAIQPMVPDMASDDFSILAPDGIRYAYWTLGSTPLDVWDGYESEGRLNELPDTHSPLFAPALEPTLRIGIDTLATAALTFLRLRDSE